ncbi:MAG: hypothetical protein SFV23_25380 [Planctomycetaceae bacterium]|nr:hypothetical protein [Planctomycetaceae bacterium]
MPTPFVLGVVIRQRILKPRTTTPGKLTYLSKYRDSAADSFSRYEDDQKDQRLKARRQ